MSESIKASEVSDVLRMQLEGIDTKLRFDEVGTVLQVSDGVVRIYGLQNAEANELLEFENGIRAVVMNLEEDNVGAVLLGPTDQIKEGDTVAVGQTLVVLEAMKMENNIDSDRAGVVKSIKVNRGDSVLEGDVLITLG